VKREAHGAASTYLNANLRPGMTLEAAAPRGTFVLGGGDGPVLLLSAGIGVTPVLSMLHELADRGGERRIWWIHAARSAREQALASEARTLLAGLPNAQEHVFYRDAGRLTRAKLGALNLPADLTAYVCGPSSFMADMQQALAALGVDPARIHTEFFTALAPINPGLTDRRTTSPHQPPGPPGTGPAVTFARSGITVPWDSRWPSVLDLADACDVPTRWSCRTGVCHTCVTPVLAGEVTFEPDPLEPPPAGETLICCARPATDVVLDL
jgi:ferredoxin-NADP reductase